MVTVHHGTLTPVFGKDLLMTVTLWFKGEQQLLDFMDWLNHQHPTVKFTANYRTVDIPYVDISLSIIDGHISTDLYIKKTDAHMYLLFTSYHPCHCTRNIPYSQYFCIRQICSEDNTFEKRCQELKERLVKRGHHQNSIDSVITKVSSVAHTNSLQY